MVSSIICACMNREENLKKSLQSWLSFGEMDEIIIVDWSSNIPFTFQHPIELPMFFLCIVFVVFMVFNLAMNEDD